MKLDVRKVGLSLGLLAAFMHLVAIALISIFGQAAFKFVAGLHFMGNELLVLPFDPAIAAFGLLATFITGYVVGAAFAWIWNSLK